MDAGTMLFSEAQSLACVLLPQCSASLTVTDGVLTVCLAVAWVSVHRITGQPGVRFAPHCLRGSNH